MEETYELNERQAKKWELIALDSGKKDSKFYVLSSLKCKDCGEITYIEKTRLVTKGVVPKCKTCLDRMLYNEDRQWKILNLNAGKVGNRTGVLCRCKYCGHEKLIEVSSAYRDVSRCEKCEEIYRQSFIGQKYNRLTIREFYDSTTYGELAYKCDCDCGTKGKVIRLSQIINNHTRSCGCLYVETRPRTHGLSHTRQYNILKGMKDRCYVPSTDSYKDYGARGIKICPEWLDEENGIRNFYEWSLENGYADDLTIERIDRNGDYCPENCTWATIEEQANNKKNNVRLDIYGNQMTFMEISRMYNMNMQDIRKEYHRNKNNIYNYIADNMYQPNIVVGIDGIPVQRPLMKIMSKVE